MTTTEVKTKVVDCDTHFWQPLELWEQHIDPKQKDKVVGHIRAHDQNLHLNDSVRAKLAETQKNRGGDYAPERLAWMDEEGIFANIIYPGQGLLAYHPDPHIAAAACRAINRWESEFMQAAPDRLKPCMMLPMRHPDLALEEFHYATQELGLDVIFAAPTPARERRWSDSALDPLWSAIQESGAVMTFHEFTRMGGDMPVVARESYRDMYALSYLCGHTVEAQLAVMDLIGGGVLERFPGLKVGFVEAHVAWLPGWLALMDSLWPRISTSYDETSGTGTLSMTPTECFRRQCFIVAFPDDAWIGEVVKYVGEDNVMFCTDFPHPQTRWGGVEMFHERQPHIAEPVARKILGENAARFFNLA